MVLNTECTPDVLEQIRKQGLTFPFSKFAYLSLFHILKIVWSMFCTVTLYTLYNCWCISVLYPTYYCFSVLLLFGYLSKCSVCFSLPLFLSQFAKHGWLMAPTPMR